MNRNYKTENGKFNFEKYRVYRFLDKLESPISVLRRHNKQKMFSQNNNQRNLADNDLIFKKNISSKLKKLRLAHLYRGIFSIR